MKISGNTRLKKEVFLIFLIVAILICIIHFYFLNKKSNKILMICLDGAGWNVMMPIIEEGMLTNIERLMESGCWGALRISVPAISEVVWTTIATAKSPYSHRITDCLIKDPETNEMIPPTSNLRRVKAIWNILSEHEKKAGVVGYKVTWPAEKVNGVIISDRASENSYFSKHYSEPPFASLFTEEIFNSFKIGKNFPAILMDDSEVCNKDIFMSNIAKYLLKNRKFDYFCLYLEGIDVYSHYYWKYMFPEGQDVSKDDISKYKDAIKNYYIWCDNIIGDLLKIVDKDTIVIVVSDHGFRTDFKTEKNYLFSKIDNLLEIANLKKFNYNSKTVILEKHPQMTWRYIIKIIGDLSKEEINAVRENTKNILKNIKVKETGKAIFRITKDTDSGFLLEPDMRHINQNPTRHLLIDGQEHKILDFLVEDRSIGDHDMTDALIIISGKDIRQHQRLSIATVYDIIPTVLYLLNLPVAADMPGKVLMSAIGLNILERKPVRYIDTYEKDKKSISQKSIRSPADEKIIKERMRSLGYIN